MYEQGADEQLICQKTGHHSVAVRSYKHTSNRQLKEVNDMLYGINKDKDVNPPKIAKLEPTSTVSTPPSESKSVETKSNIEKVTVTKEDPTTSHSFELTKGLTLNININVQK